jgi:hypothetical protein
MGENSPNLVTLLGSEVPFYHGLLDIAGLVGTPQIFIRFSRLISD